MTAKRALFYIVMAVLACFVALLFLVYEAGRRNSRGHTRMRAKAEIMGVAQGLEAFEATFNKLPEGNNSDICRTLLGANPRQLRFLYFNRTNKIGELLDPWESPYQIQILDHTNFAIRSAGRNRAFGDKDDFVFNRLKNDFVTP